LAAILSEEVINVRHWTDRLFSFVVTRHPSFRFEAGQFTMIDSVTNAPCSAARPPAPGVVSITSAAIRAVAGRGPLGPMKKYWSLLNVG